MKKLLLLSALLIFSQIGFSQVDVNIDKTISFDEEANENYTPYDYIGNRVYKYFYQTTYQVSHKKFVTLYLNPLIEELNEFCSRNNYSYEVVSSTTKDI